MPRNTTAAKPVGSVTRGTTNTNRLRRVDRWIAHRPEFAKAASPLVVDLGFGASGVTSFELWARLARVRRDARLVGLEIEQGRVAFATGQLAEVRAGRTGFDPATNVSFARGGFEVPLPGGETATVIRAFNVLRQYDEAEVADAWARMRSRLAPGGLLVEGTCDELGRVCSWVDLSPAGPERFTISLRLAGLDLPSIVAERLPKALIHRNVPGERVHEWLSALDAAWRTASVLAPYGERQRWIGAIAALRDAGWPVLGGRTRWRLGEVTVPWGVVAPLPAPGRR
ncbi:class I SAM-dependent methyltransferase [Gryllotalpicola protaetiae]|uniref:Class I SAM-dependent methyltransferase n=1 Tax=Gryllotalpicola protaetiae TaxID=2419771 RepID=A0A387BL00_9MICO|nr:class I SAM-dependent methyltransferase [Gryllotalpicola protaetiae]AYG02844.1 class I SAM-dependent methyltransferase [Gryllotalpicola protaetiae]